jgi:hypothetical protein
MGNVVGVRPGVQYGGVTSSELPTIMHSRPSYISFASHDLTTYRVG